jgi:hypothetical protein
MYYTCTTDISRFQKVVCSTTLNRPVHVYSNLKSMQYSITFKYERKFYYLFLNFLLSFVYLFTAGVHVAAVEVVT